jgi:hypothetical protein
MDRTLWLKREIARLTPIADKYARAARLPLTSPTNRVVYRSYADSLYRRIADHRAELARRTMPVAHAPQVRTIVREVVVATPGVRPGAEFEPAITPEPAAPPEITEIPAAAMPEPPWYMRPWVWAVVGGAALYMWPRQRGGGTVVVK